MAEASYSIRKMVQLTHLTAPTLRYYEELGLLGEVPRNTSGHRAYQEKHLQRVRFLLLLKDTGMPLEEMRTFALLDDLGAQTAPDRVQLLFQHHQHLQQKLEVLHQQLQYLGNKIQYYQQVCQKYGLPDPLQHPEQPDPVS